LPLELEFVPEDLVLWVGDDAEAGVAATAVDGFAALESRLQPEIVNAVAAAKQTVAAMRAKGKSGRDVTGGRDEKWA
jgi:hypothetical protein